MMSLFPTSDWNGEWPFGHAQRRGHFTPHVTTSEDEKYVHFELEVPRFGPEDIKVTVDLDRGLLTVAGKRLRGDGSVESEFERRFSVYTELLDLSEVNTTVQHGVVRVSVAKRPPPPPEPKEESKALTTTSSASGGLTVASFDAASSMHWPPKFELKEEAKELVYTAGMPAALTAENVDVHLERGGALSVAVRANVENVRKDDKGHVVQSESRSVHYATMLGVPRSTHPEDVSVTLRDGTLRIAVAKHEGSGKAQIKVLHA